MCEHARADQTTQVPPGLFEFTLAVDVDPNWKNWFRSPEGGSEQPNRRWLLNYLAGLFETLNAILMRDAGIRVRITHVHIWENEWTLIGKT